MPTQHTIDRHGHAKCTGKPVEAGALGSRIFDGQGTPNCGKPIQPPGAVAVSCFFCIELNRAFIAQHDEQPGSWIHEFLEAVPGSTGIHLSADATTGFTWTAEERAKTERIALAAAAAARPGAPVTPKLDGAHAGAVRSVREAARVREEVEADARDKCLCGWPLPESILPIHVNAKTVRVMNVMAAARGASVPGSPDLKHHVATDAFVTLRCPTCGEGGTSSSRRRRRSVRGSFNEGVGGKAMSSREHYCPRCHKTWHCDGYAMGAVDRLCDACLDADVPSREDRRCDEAASPAPKPVRDIHARIGGRW